MRSAPERTSERRAAHDAAQADAKAAPGAIPCSGFSQAASVETTEGSRVDLELLLARITEELNDLDDDEVAARLTAKDSLGVALRVIAE